MIDCALKFETEKRGIGMINRKLIIALACVFAFDTAAMAQTVAPSTLPLRSGALIKSADGKRLGSIDAIVNGPDGKPQTAEVINELSMLYIPASTITAVDKSHFVTSLTYSAVIKR
jgi:hypothetical protein